MLIIFISAIFIAMTCILYLIFSRPRRPQQVATTMSLMEWAKEASKHLEDSQLDRPIWLLGIYAGCGVVGLIFGFAYFHTVPAGILCGLLAFFIPEQFVNQRLLVFFKELDSTTIIFSPSWPVNKVLTPGSKAIVLPVVTCLSGKTSQVIQA
jgi:hypothetical protein